MRKNDIETLEKVIEECEAVCYPELRNELQEAKTTLDNLEGGREG